ncbi:HlyD family secretion protein, partial [Arthrospira platensis SPKY1]|nr:HlyD family secretion protein [Arthrospira platensis SPKY1]
AFDNAGILAANNLRSFETEVDIRQQELAAAIDNLALLREGASRNSQQVANIVVSTLDGMVLDVPVKEGSSVIERNNFNEGTTIAIVADMNALIFEGKVDESDVGKLREGMPLELTVGA